MTSRVDLKMPNFPPPPPSQLQKDLNRRVLEHVAAKFAHSDLSEVLQAAIKPLGDVELYCPDWPKYHYLVASTRHVIFGFAIGMNTIAFRLDRVFEARALATGAAAYPACGEGWVSFMPFRADWPRIDFEFWALQAYVHARTLGEE